MDRVVVFDPTFLDEEKSMVFNLLVDTASQLMECTTIFIRTTDDELSAQRAEAVLREADLIISLAAKRSTEGRIFIKEPRKIDLSNVRDLLATYSSSVQKTDNNKIEITIEYMGNDFRTDKLSKEIARAIKNQVEVYLAKLSIPSRKKDKARKAKK